MHRVVDLAGKTKRIDVIDGIGTVPQVQVACHAATVRPVHAATALVDPRTSSCGPMFEGVPGAGLTPRGTYCQCRASDCSSAVTGLRQKWRRPPGPTQEAAITIWDVNQRRPRFPATGSVGAGSDNAPLRRLFSLPAQGGAYALNWSNARHDIISAGSWTPPRMSSCASA